jgi:antitoxin component of MazEF toxin-antitoxin module
MSMDLKSTVSVAKIGTNSLRATIPQGIVSYLNIQPGDKLHWRMIDKSGKRVVMIFMKKRDSTKQLEQAFSFKHLSLE